MKRFNAPKSVSVGRLFQGPTDLSAKKYLGEDDAGNDTLRDGAEDCLKHQQRDGTRAAVGNGTRAVADSVLRLDGKQQSRGEPVDAFDARLATVPGLHQPPQQREQNPAQHERHQVDEDVVPAITGNIDNRNR